MAPAVFVNKTACSINQPNDPPSCTDKYWPVPAVAGARIKAAEYCKHAPIKCAQKRQLAASVLNRKSWELNVVKLEWICIVIQEQGGSQEEEDA